MRHSKSYYHQRWLRIRKRDEVFADKFLDLSNLAGAALIFGQFISQQKFSLLAFFIGSSWVIAAYIHIWYYLSKFD